MPAESSVASLRDPTPLRRIPAADTVPGWSSPLTEFIGRADDIEAVSERCRTDGVRLVTITGPGGIGKTRLAIEVATRIADAFDDGVVFVSLAALRDPDLVPVTVAQALGVPTLAGQSLHERLRSFLQHKRLLLIIDNMEHLLAAGPPFAEMLAQHPALTILCTSRTRLGLSGEHLFAISSLDPVAASQLFVQQARAQDSRFELTASTVPTVEEICNRLDRFPLAIELAAARVATLPLDAMLERLERRLPLLTGGPRDAPERQRTMRDTIAWSYGLLQEDEQVAFQRLSICVGGFTLGAADAIVRDGADALDIVESLVANSLVSRTQSGFGELRFAMLETIREFGLDLLQASGADTAAHHAHAIYYTQMAESEVPNYDGPTMRAAHDRVEADLDNCRSAMGWAVDSGEAMIGNRLAGALWRIWWYGQVTGGRPWTERVTEGRSWLERTLTLRDGLPVGAIADAMAGAGHLARFQDDLDQGQALGEELLDRAQAEGHHYGTFWALHLLGWIAESRDQPRKAQHLYESAIAVAPTIRNPENHAAMTLVRLSGISDRAGDLEKAANGFGEAYALYLTCGNPAGIATATFNLGRVMRKRGNLSEASRLLEVCLTGFQGQRDLGGVHASLVELALVALATGSAPNAVQLLSMAQTYPGHPDCRPAYEDALASASSRVTGPAFTKLWQAGQKMSLDEIIVIAGTLAANHAAIVAGLPHSEHGLSRRETEVLGLIADGRSNRGVAETLSISERTVENHVQHILAKLNLESRTAAATYAIRQGLV